MFGVRRNRITAVACHIHTIILNVYSAVLTVFDIFVNKGATLNSPDKNAYSYSVLNR